MNKPTAKDRAAANAARREEYGIIRDRLAGIATAAPAANITARDRIDAARLLYELDTKGTPPAYKW